MCVGEREMMFRILPATVFGLLLLPQSISAEKLREHKIEKGDTPAGLARRYSVSYDEILRFNQMTPGSVLKVGTTLRIPRKGEVTGSTYKVKRGDSVARIADFHGVGQDDLRAANNLEKGKGVQVGQTISIPHILRGGATRGHVIRKGDSLALIAGKYKVAVADLARANKLRKGMPLELGRTLIIPEDENDAGVYKPKRVSKLVKSGRKVPGGVKHEVQPGQSLWIIARAYNVSGDRIAAANDFEKGDGVTAGQEILIPGARQVVPVRVKGFSIQPINFISVWNNKRVNLRLLNDKGRIIQRNRTALSRLAGPKGKSKRVRKFHPRLIHMLQRVAERYPDKSIEIISGYRVPTPGRRLSKHNLGQAIDFRVQGVDRKALFEFIRTLPDVGAGYYPNSVFIHMDVRDKPGFWIDYSGIGEPADYRNEGLDPEAAADAE